MNTKNTVHAKTVTETALFKRCARKMAKEGVKLHRNSNARWMSCVGIYYTTTPGDHIDAMHLDLAALGYETGCLHDDETLVQ